MPTKKDELTNLRKKLDEKMQWEKRKPSKGKKKKSLRKIENDSQTVRTCPHCGVTGRGQSMFRWHFKRCPKMYQSLLESETSSTNVEQSNCQDHQQTSDN
jgi:hypothetical protein